MRRVDRIAGAARGRARDRISCVDVDLLERVEQEREDRRHRLRRLAVVRVRESPRRRRRCPGHRRRSQLDDDRRARDRSSGRAGDPERHREARARGSSCRSENFIGAPAFQRSTGARPEQRRRQSGTDRRSAARVDRASRRSPRAPRLVGDRATCSARRRRPSTARRAPRPVSWTRMNSGSGCSGNSRRVPRDPR